MNKQLVFLLLVLTNHIAAQDINAIATKQLNVEVPSDLKSLWSDNNFKNTNRIFFYYNYNEMLFLANSDLHEFTLSREVSGSMNESNGLYTKREEGIVTESYYRKNKELLFLDPVMISKMVRNSFEREFPSLKNCIVFAASTWQEGFTYLFYGFDASNKNSGIWMWKMENSGQILPRSSFSKTITLIMWLQKSLNN